MFSSFPISHIARHSVKPQFIGTADNANSFSINGGLNILKPSGVRSGDLMFALIAAHNSDDVNPPGGWTILFESPGFVVQGEDRSIGLYYKRAGVEQGGSYTFQVSAVGFGTVYACGVIVAYRRASVKKAFATSFDRTSIYGTSHDYLVPSSIRDQFPVLLTGWHAMKSGNSSATPSSSMTGRGDAEIGGGQDYARTSFFEQELTGPSDPLIGTSVNVSYSQNVDIETYGIVLEGSYA